MKASEYFERYQSTGCSIVELDRILDDFLKEADEIAKIRRAQVPSAYIAILMELEQKWRTFAGLAGDSVKKNAFSQYVNFKNPDFLKNLRPGLAVQESSGRKPAYNKKKFNANRRIQTDVL